MRTLLVFASIALCFAIIGCSDVLFEPPAQEVQEESKDITIIYPDEQLEKYPILATDIQKFSSQMEKNFIDMYEVDEVDPIDTRDWALDIEMEVLRDDELVVSILSQAYMYTGGAHGNVFYHTWNYDVGEGKILNLGDILLDSDVALGSLSNLIRQDLLARQVSDEKWISEGAGAEIQNFSTWSLTPGGDVRFTFDPYQVAPYAAGPQDVILSSDVMKDLIKSQYLPLLGIENIETQ